MHRTVRTGFSLLSFPRILLLLTIAWLTSEFPVAAVDVKFGYAIGIGGTDRDHGEAITTDSDGNVYITGDVGATADFDPGPGTVNLSYTSYVLKLDSSANLVWAKSVGGKDITVDASGNVYLTGAFGGTRDFDPGPGIFNLTSVGLYDIFVCKLDSAGSLVWARAIASDLDSEVALNDGGTSITVDDAGNVYTAGHFDGMADFDPGPEEFFLTSVGQEDIFVLKLDANGNFDWAKAMGSPGNERAQGIALDGFGNVYTTGQFEGTVDFDPGPGIFNIVGRSSFEWDIFVQKLNASGEFVWAKAMGAVYGDSAFDIAVDSVGNVYTTGSFAQVVDFDPGPKTYNMVADFSRGPRVPDIFIQKLDTHGEFLWAKSMGGPRVDTGIAIALDDFGNVYTTGSFVDTVDFDPGPDTVNLSTVPETAHDIYVHKLDTNGVFEWVQAFSGISGFDSGAGVAVDLFGDVYTIGQFQNTVDFDPGPGVFNLTSSLFASDIFVSKLIQPVEVISIESLGPNPNYDPFVEFTVTFTKPVSGVDETDFVIDEFRITGAAITNVAGSGAVYTVTVSTSPGAGTLSIDLIDDDTIVASGLPLGGAGLNNGNFTTGQYFRIGNNPPLPIGGSTILTLIGASILLSAWLIINGSFSGGRRD
jgi:hypothetical protein